MKRVTLFLSRWLPGLVLAMIVVSCDGKFEPDPIDPRIPRYSEEELGAAGAFVNEESWRAVLSGGGFFVEPSQRLRVTRDSTQIRLSIEGRIRERNLDNNLFIEFYLDNTDGELDSIVSLRNRKFTLGEEHRAAVLENPSWFEDVPFCPSSTGQLYIRRLDPIFREDDTEYAISGTFSFVVDQDTCSYYAVTHGRFDYRVEGY